LKDDFNDHKSLSVWRAGGKVIVPFLESAGSSCSEPLEPNTRRHSHFRGGFSFLKQEEKICLRGKFSNLIFSINFHFGWKMLFHSQKRKERDEWFGRQTAKIVFA
jgi:hypothetical protein